jgi:hypothetical protein
VTKEEAGKRLSGRVLMKTRAFPEAITFEELAALDIPSGTLVVGSCFSCEVPSEPFPKTMRGVRFLRCNLDNVTLPPGNPELGKNERCSRRRFRANPADGRDWSIDAAGEFVAALE